MSENHRRNEFPEFETWEDPAELDPGWTWSRLLAAAMIVIVVLGWCYLFFLASNVQGQTLPTSQPATQPSTRPASTRPGRLAVAIEYNDGTVQIIPTSQPALKPTKVNMSIRITFEDGSVREYKF